MKKVLTIVMLLAVMGVAMAQRPGVKEYVSVLITFNDTNMLPQDSLNKYGVFLQTRTGRMANALIEADQYQNFLNAGLVERVQPSTRVMLRDEQVNPFAHHHHHGEACSHDGKKCNHDGEKCNHDGKKCNHDGKECDRKGHKHHGHHGEVAEMEAEIDSNAIAEDALDNHGFYLGLMLGGSSNAFDAELPLWDGEYFTRRGINLEARFGYQFNEWFGIRSGIQMMSKNYSADLNVKYLNFEGSYTTDNQNLYLQLPVMADLSLGGEAVRIHFMAGGYAGFWATQWRQGYVYVSGDERPWTGNAYHFVKAEDDSFSDNRFDAGLAGGLGLELRVAPAWRLLFEGNYYHGLISTSKGVNALGEAYKTFNRTWTFGMGVTYQF
ncbi:MAG: PorT family protein [Bacteroidales bacterium]|nr:PorT family protein [Bacteroidales bacterium]